MYVYGFELIILALCLFLYLCHTLVNFVDLSVPIYKWICLLLSGSLFWNGFHKNLTKSYVIFSSDISYV